ncbi:MAG: hypothetical protein AAF602_00560, partial [Myxococcota bacterium]
MVDPDRLESLGPAERIVQAVLTWTDHLVHNRPGMVVPDAASVTGTRWIPVIWKLEGSDRVVYELRGSGRRAARIRVGVLREDGQVVRDADVVGQYRRPGLYPEVAAWLYRQVADIYGLDNAFVAHWASHAFGETHRDLKVVLAAFLLVQTRRGDPVRGEGGEVLFHDDDLRDVGEAMCLLRRADKRDLHPKLLLRVGELLSLPEVAAINRELGFGRSARNPALGRWPRVVDKWLRHRERNLPMLEGLVRA